MNINQTDQPESDFPRGIGRPATQALTAAGYWRLDQLAGVSEAKLKKLHGVGPKAIDVLRRALADKGLSFASEKSRKEQDNK
jgi:predicted flap endonuclease-1-like 5' DNA nuclease